MVHLQPTPINRCKAVGLEVGVGAAKGAGAEKAAAGAEGAWVWAFYDVVLALVDEGAFALGMGAPEDKDHRRLSCAQRANDGIGKGFPAVSGVTFGCAFAYGEGGV